MSTTDAKRTDNGEIEDPMSVPVKIVVVYHSGYGHTVKIAEAVARGAAAINGASIELVTAEEAPGRWELLDGADAIIMGGPTYMGSLSAPFKAFMDATSHLQYVEKRWEGKVAAGFTNGASRGGDKQNSLVQLMTFAARHQMHWVNLGLNYGNNRSYTNEDILNRDSYTLGMAPGPIETAMLDRITGSADRKATLVAGLPLKRAGRPEEIADSILFAASDRASFISGQIIAVNGGKTAS